jgi:hypothetical protein
MSHHQNAGKSHNLLIANRYFEECDIVQMSGKDYNKSKLHLSRN